MFRRSPVAPPLSQARHDPLVISHPAADVTGQFPIPDNSLPALISVALQIADGDVPQLVSKASNSVLEISHEHQRTRAVA